MNGRRRINIFIDWGNPTPAKVWNAVADAVAAWNSATDAYSNTTGYYFVVDQNKSIANPPDITIRDGGSASSLCGGAFGCTTASNSWNSPDPAYIDLASENLSSGYISADDIKSTIAHEMAHFMGIWTTGCSGNTIMGPTNSLGQSIGVYDPSTADVAMANSGMNNPQNCTATGGASRPQVYVETGGGSYEDTQQDHITNLDQQYRCTFHYLVTEYCAPHAGGCTYLYSTWEFLYYDNCELESDSPVVTPLPEAKPTAPQESPSKERELSDALDR